MEKKGNSTVELVADSLNDKRAFSVEHAERLLAMRDSGWRLPNDSAFEYSKENGIVRKSNKSNTKSA